MTDDGVLAVPEDALVHAAAPRERLVQRRWALGLSQRRLAELLDVDRSTVARWERGKSQPMPAVRARLAEALGIPAGRLDEILAASDPPSPGGTGPAAPNVPRQLPAAVADFAGRAAELAALTKTLDDAAGSAPGTVVISAIGGTAGVGKTALALHWAHLVAGRFEDGQLYVNLRGFDPSGSPASPETAVRGFLGALGVPPERVPPSLEAQVGLYRSLLADREMLIVLDNARDEQQVRPLLPASPGSLVLVTSRNSLSGLAAADGARLLTLDVLSHDEAVQLVTERLGAAGTAADPGAVAEIAELCACLPLALAIAVARAGTRPGFPLAALAGELRDAASRLDALDAGDRAASVRAVFSWSYAQLSADAARLFRLLGLHPGPDISVPAAASLAGTDEPAARRMLRELTRAHLIAEHRPGRYAFHDLLRAYAAAQARADDSDAGRAGAVARVLDHYLHTAGPAGLQLNPANEPIALAPPRPGVRPERFDDYGQAMAWFEAEHQVLLAAVTLADHSGFDVHAWQLPWAMEFFLEIRGHYGEWVATSRTALAAVTRLGDAAGQAVSSRLLGHACTRVGDYEQARTRLASSLELYQQLGDRLGEARAHRSLGILDEQQGRYADALRHEEQSLRLCQATGDKAGQAVSLNNVGWFHGLLGDYGRAGAFCRRAVTLNAEVGNRRAEAAAWDSVGYAEHHLGNLDGAVACYQRARSLYRESGARVGEAWTLTRLGDTRHAACELAQARDAWQQALAIYEDVRHPNAEKVRAKLASLDAA